MQRLGKQMFQPGKPAEENAEGTGRPGWLGKENTVW